MRTKSDKTAIAIIAALAALDVLVWIQIFSGAPKESEEIHFLDVGQGDAILTVLPGGVKILTDAGPDSRIRRALQNVLPADDRYLDLAVITHPQLDHFGGFRELLRSYKFGAFIWNGREGDLSMADWREFKDEIRKQDIPLIAVSEGDRIRSKNAEVRILSPNRVLLQSAELNDTAIVQMLEMPSFRFLSAADAGLEIEKRLQKKYDLRAEILKVGHHGSKYSSGIEFLNEVRPRLAVISVGRGNRYGHPAPEILKRLKFTAGNVFRTDENGTISVFTENGKIRVFTKQ